MMHKDRRLSANRLFLAGLMMMGVGLLLATGVREAKAQEPSCVTGQCHSRMGKEAHVHLPAKLGQCTFCHKPVDEKTMFDGPRHRFTPAADGSALCYTCHEPNNTKDVVHPPVQVGMCTFCHDPHQSANPLQLKVQLPDLCLTCHVNIKELLDEATVVHGAVNRDKKCANCHNPHSSNQEKLLKRVGLDICLFCHNVPITDHKGKKLLNIKAWLEKNPNHHGPIQAQSCVFCHDPHGSKNFRLLVRAFPPTLYASFSEANYALCLGCHDPAVSTPTTDSDTDFRNGNKSLHFVHVNKDPKGRTCRFCHDVHASTKPRLIRESISFGQFNLPTNYKALPNGGKCRPGCHAPQGYDRVTPVVNPIDYETFEGPKTHAVPEKPSPQPKDAATQTPRDQ